MNRASPFTYVVEGLMGTSMANADAGCETNEFISFTAPNGTTCGDYMKTYLSEVGGYIVSGTTSECQYCKISGTNRFLESKSMSYDNRWRDFGFLWVYCVFNIAAAFAIYWVVRVPKKNKGKKE